MIVKPVVGFEGRYEVDSDGNVWSVARTVRRGFATHDLPREQLATAEGGRAKNYLRVMLMGAGRKRKHAYVHQIVAEAFHGAQPNGTVVCHKNDIGTDNRPDNLYYGTDEDNQTDKHVNSLPLKTMEQAPF